MAARGRPTVKLPRPMLGRERAAFLARRAQDRAQARGAGARAAERAGRRRSLRELPGGGRRHPRRPDGARLRALRAARREGGATRAGRRRRRRRQSTAESGARSHRAQAHLPPRRAAAGALHRQCGDDRLGRRRCGLRAAWSTISPRPPARAGRSTPMRRPRSAPASRRELPVATIPAKAGSGIRIVALDSGFRRNDDAGRLPV